MTSLAESAESAESDGRCRVLLVGGPDVDARIDLMHRLVDEFDIAAVGSSPQIADRFADAGFGYTTYRLSRRMNPLTDLVSLVQLWRTFRKLKPHVVHTFDTKAGVWGCLAGKLAGVPVVIFTLTGLGSLYASETAAIRAIRFVYERLQTLVCHIADLTVFQNHSDARRLVARGITPCEKSEVVLGSGVSTEAFSAANVTAERRAQLRTELGVGPEELMITMVSRVIRSKGVLEFVGAARHLGPLHDRLRFVLLGAEDRDNPDRLLPRETAELREHLIWPGPTDDVPGVLAATDIFVLPTAYPEGIPRSLLEAASMGLPLVATVSPGCDDVVESGVNGILVPIGDQAALEQAIARLAEDPELRERFGAESRRRAVTRFDSSVVAKQTRHLYRRLLAAARVPGIRAGDHVS